VGRPHEAADSSVEADAAAARGEEDKVLGEDGRARLLARRLAEVLPRADDPALEVLPRGQAGLRDLDVGEGDGGVGEVAGGHRAWVGGGVGDGYNGGFVRWRGG